MKTIEQILELIKLNAYSGTTENIQAIVELVNEAQNQALPQADVSGSFTLDDIRKAFEGGRDSVEPEIGYEHFGDMEAYPKKKIVKSFKQWMHENYR